jgi:hypothetical protein
LDDFLGEPRGSVRFAVFNSENRTKPNRAAHLTKFSNFYYILLFHVTISYFHSFIHTNHSHISFLGLLSSSLTHFVLSLSPSLTLAVTHSHLLLSLLAHSQHGFRLSLSQSWLLALNQKKVILQFVSIFVHVKICSCYLCNQRLFMLFFLLQI